MRGKHTIHSRRICPECKGNIVRYDRIHDELTCRQCGLVLQAPAQCGLIFPGMKIVPTRKKWHIRAFFIDVSVNYILPD